MGDSETILQEAQRLVYGDRGADYGHPLDNFNQTAGMWTALLQGKLKPGATFTAEDVGMALVCLKLSRQQNRPKRDNMTDAAGYAATVQMCLDERERRKTVETT